MSDVTHNQGASPGSAISAEQLLPLVYEELRKLAVQRLASESSGQSLQPTDLVHEAYLRLVDQSCQPEWDSTGHFFAAAAESMRRILVDRARKRLSLKRGGDRRRVQLNDVQTIETADEADPAELLAIHQALDQLEREDPTKAQLVKLRYFTGMSLEQAATAMGISRATASRYWTYTRAWLSCALDDQTH